MNRPPPALVELAHELSADLLVAQASGDDIRAGELRGELALLEDLALPEAVSELRLQRLALRAVVRAMRRPLPAPRTGSTG